MTSAMPKTAHVESDWPSPGYPLRDARLPGHLQVVNSVINRAEVVLVTLGPLEEIERLPAFFDRILDAERLVQQAHAKVRKIGVVSAIVQ